MTITDIQQLIADKTVPDQPNFIELIETHTAWVLLTKQYAYKIKKPVVFSFLDFSTFEKRHFYCEQELALNRRLAPDIYLKVLPIKQFQQQIFIGDNEGETIDHCLQMIRMDNQKEMNRLLTKDQVTEKDVQAIAQQLATFHKKAKPITKSFDKNRLKNNFADVLTVSAIVGDHCGLAASQTLQEAVNVADAFVDKFAHRLEWRQQNGYVRDVHGDLHSGNIFLLDKPVIFDCIEFRDSFRQIDLLNEIAFLCMDMEYHDKPMLSEAFLKSYLTYLPCIFNEEDRQLLLFYKWYRAGIRMKVKCLALHDRLSKKKRAYVVYRIQQFYHLFEKYFSDIKKNTFTSQNAFEK